MVTTQLNPPTPGGSGDDGKGWVYDHTTDRMVLSALVKAGALVLNVKDYGAKGDGTTDDSAAFAAADSAGPGDIIVPPGTYRVYYMNVSANRRFIGVGKPVIRGNTSTEAVVYLNGDGAALIGIEVDGNSLAQYCVEATNNPHQVVQRCKLYGATSQAILVYLAGVSIKANDISGQGIKLDTNKSCSVLNNEIYSMTDNNGVYVTGQFTLNYGAHRHQIRGNHIHDIGAATGTGQTGNGVLVYQAGDVAISDNLIHDTRYSFVRLNGARRTDASGNVCSTSGETGFFVEFSFRDVVVRGNVLNGTTGSGIAFANVNDGSAGHNGVIADNVLTACGPTGSSIYVEGAAAVTGNQVDTAGYAGIQLGYGGCWDIECTGNRITDTSATPTLKVGIVAELASDGVYTFANVDVARNTISNAQLANYGGHTFSAITDAGGIPYPWPYSYATIDGGVLTGTGSPEGAVGGNVGYLFRRSDGGRGTALYTKESGLGITGWNPTGWNPRQINPLAWYDVQAGGAAGQTLADQMYGTAVTLGSTSGTDTNDPTWLTWSGGDYVWLPGATSNFNGVSMPDAAALRITGDIDLRVAGIFATAADAVILAKWAGSGQGAYEWGINNSWAPWLGLTANGSTFVSVTSSAGFTPGTPICLKVTWRQSDGRVQFFTKSTTETTAVNDLRSTSGWTQLGTNQTLSVASIFAGNAALTLGSDGDGLNGHLGKYFAAQVRNGIDGTVIADFAPPKFFNGSALTYVDAVGSIKGTWTIGRNHFNPLVSLVKERAELLFKTNSLATVPTAAIPAFGTTGAGTIIVVARPWADALSNGRWLDTRGSATETVAGVGIRQNGTANSLVATIGDGTNTAATAAVSYTAGKIVVASLVVDATTIKVRVNGVESATVSRPAGSATGTTPIVGAATTAAASPTEFDWFAVLTANRAMTASDLAAVESFYGAGT